MKKDIKAARDLIADPTRWCQGTSARSKEGISCGIDEPIAHKFCAVGAMVKMGCTELEIYLVNDVAEELHPQRFSCFSPLAMVNDKLGHEAVLQVFDTYLEKNA